MHLFFLGEDKLFISDSDSLGKYLEDKVKGRVCPGVKDFHD